MRLCSCCSVKLVDHPHDQVCFACEYKSKRAVEELDDHYDYHDYYGYGIDDLDDQNDY